MTVSAIIMMVVTVGCTWGLFMALLAVAARSESAHQANRRGPTTGVDPTDKHS